MCSVLGVGMNSTRLIIAGFQAVIYLVFKYLLELLTCVFPCLDKGQAPAPNCSVRVLRKILKK